MNSTITTRQALPLHHQADHDASLLTWYPSQRHCELVPSHCSRRKNIKIVFQNGKASFELSQTNLYCEGILIAAFFQCVLLTYVINVYMHWMTDILCHANQPIFVNSYSECRRMTWISHWPFFKLCRCRPLFSTRLWSIAIGTLQVADKLVSYSVPQLRVMQVSPLLS